MATPRMNASTLPSYVGHNIRIVGRVHTIDSSTNRAEIETSDGKLVGINSTLVNGEKMENGMVYEVGSCVEVVGLVQNDGTIQEYNAINFGNNFDLGNYERLMQFQHGKYQNLFLPTRQ